MHKKITIFLFLFIPALLTAQKAKPKNDSNYDERLLHFGFSMGMNAMDFKVSMNQPGGPLNPDGLKAEVVSLKPGINIQIVTDFRPSIYLDLRFLPGVSFGQRNINFYDSEGVMWGESQVLESSFLEFPLLLKAKGMRLNNSRPYLIGGVNFRYDLAGKKEYDEERPVYLRLKRADFNYEVGAGIDFYLPYFKLTIEAKMSNGLRDVLVHEPAPGYPEYTNSISSLRSQMWVLSFHFE
ncbi:MAG: porin family protein [Bacteroidales bacterium]|nr:porin family protein [Bacteroidales bacterium]MDT8372493.1 porin family protein [Bacteroidales bacterium]